MKSVLLFLLLLPLSLWAQEDPKYLAGAVPVVDGKVLFSREITAPGLTKEQIYDRVLQWAEQRFAPHAEFHCQVLYKDAEKGQIVCQGQEYLVFADKALSLDRSLTTYQMFIEVASGTCYLKVTAIRYSYFTSSESIPETLKAENVITDENTLTRKKDRLLRATGKFRIKTIDLVEELFQGVETALGVTATTAATPSVPSTVQPEPTAYTVNPALPFRKITPEKIPGNIIKMLSEDWMLITAGNDQDYNMMTASWGGLGHLYGKPVAFCFINPARHTYQLMEKGDTYTLSFYTEAYREALQYCGTHSGKETDKVKGSGLTPITLESGNKTFAEAWMVIECKKLVSQSFTPEALSDEALREKWEGKQLHKMYIGEILNVWIK